MSSPNPTVSTVLPPPVVDLQTATSSVSLAAPESAATQDGNNTPIIPVTGVTAPADYLKMLRQYMTAMMLALATVTQIQAQLTQQQNDVQNTMNQQAQKQVTQAQDDLKKLEEAIEKAKSAGLLSRILGDVLGGLMAAIGLGTGNPALLLMGASMVAMQESGATNKLQDLLANVPGGQIWGNVLLAVGMAAVSMGVGYGMAQVSAATAAAASSSGAAASSGGAAVAAESAGGAASGSAASGAGAGTSSLTESLKTLGFRTLEFTSLFNPWMYLAKKSGEQFGNMVGSELAGQIIGSIGGMAMTMSAAGYGAAKDPAFLGKSAQNISYRTVGYLQNASVATTGVQGVGEILQGVAQMQMADAVKQQGQTNGEMSFYQSLLQILGSLQSDTAQSNSLVSRRMGDVISNSRDLISGWVVTAQNM